MRIHPAAMLCATLLPLLSTPVLGQESGAQNSADPTPMWAKPLAQLELAPGDSLVFLGDSITHQCLYTQYVEDYFYTRYPKMRLKIHNAGVGGAVAWDALQRFDEDVAAYQPKYVTILLGMNEHKIFEANQPQPRCYELKRLKSGG